MQQVRVETCPSCGCGEGRAECLRCKGLGIVAPGEVERDCD